MHQFHRPDLPSAPRRALPAFLGRALRAATSPGAIARGLFAAAAALALCAAPAFAQCTNYTVVAGPAQYITAGTDIGNHDDEAMTSITLPFPVSVYGNTYTSAYVSSNGYIEFGSDGQFYQNSCLPLSNTDYSTFISASSPTVVAILPFWTDLSTYNPLSPDNGKGVYTEVLGTPGSQDFVVEWRAFANGLTDSTVFFEVIFHENQTYFDYVYYTLPALSNATIGVSRTDLDIMTFALTHTAAQYECFANTLGATAVKGFGSTSLRFTWCASTVGACCDSEAACIVAFSSDSCQGTSQFQPGVACSPSPCTAPSNDGCASATDIASLFFPNDPNPIDNGAAADDTTDCGTASHGIWYSYFASEDTALRCAAIGSQKASWATAPDCSTLPHCVSGGTSTSVFVPAGQSVNLLASNASPAADPAAPLILSFHTRTAVSDSACTIAPTTTAYVAGDTDIGNHSSPGTDASTALAFPFPVSLYGLSYTGANVSDNGYIEFGGPTANPSYLCLPVSNLPNAAIFPYREDLITSTAGGKGIFTSLSGSPGGRRFVVEWRAARYSVYVSPNTIQMKFEVIFYENQPYFDMVYDTIPAFGGATVGVQASGTGPSTQFECNSNVGNALTDLAGGLALRVTTNAVIGACCNSGGACSLQAISNPCDAPSTFTLGVSCSPSPCPPPQNDTCAAASDLGTHVYAANPSDANAQVMSNLIVPYKAIEYVGSAGDDLAACSIYHGVWFTYTAPTQSTLLVTETGAQTAVWATAPDCASTPACLSGQTNLKIQLAAGQTIKVLAGTSTSAIDPTVPLTMAFSLLPDECATALPLAPPTTNFGTLQNATATSGGAQNVCNFSTNRDLWYSINATRAGEYTISGTPFGLTSTAPLALDLFDSCGGARLACAVRSGSVNPSITIQLTPGTYKLRVASTTNGAMFHVDITAPPCLADFDQSGSLAVADIFAFLNAWFAGDPRSDFDGASGIQVADIFAFLNAWFAGC